MGTTKTWNWRHAFIVIIIPVIILAIMINALNGFIPFLQFPVKGNSTSSIITWVVLMGLVTFLIFTIGHGVTGELLGALIDGRNRMSLSKLQLIVWTIIILSALITAALWNLVIGKSAPLNIAVPPEIWVLLGISTASFVGTPLVLDPKTKTPPNPDQLQRQLGIIAQQKGMNTKAAQNAEPTPTVEFAPDSALPSGVNYTASGDLLKQLQIVLRGQVPGYETPKKASLGDMFRGDETGNFAQMDISKIQMLLFTVLIVFIYASAIGTMFASADPKGGIGSLPALSQSIVILIGISHAGYLTYKGVSHSASPTTPSVSTI